jgi:hypothetical protein
MGFWHQLKNINNAEGIRETMRMSYDKHLKLAQNGKIPLNGETPHRTALYGALGSRFRVSGVPVDNVIAEALIWADLMPFLYLDSDIGREALAEYVVYKEMPKDAKISWLTTLVQKGCQIAQNNHEEYNMLITIAKTNGAVWLLLLEGKGNNYFW